MKIKTILQNPRERNRFLKFSVVGAFGALVDFGTLNLLMSLLNVAPKLLQAISFTAAVTSNFIWNRVWTYPDSRSKSITSQLGKFFLVNIFGLGIRTLIFSGLEEPFRNLFSKLRLLPIGFITDDWLGINFTLGIAIVVVMFWNFFINRIWTYNDVD